MLCGLPCSGKTRRAQQLADYFTQINVEAKVINLETLNLDRHTVYKDVVNEKKGRSTLFAAAIRFLSEKRVVIVDYDNNIKGYRYQLHCAARETGTTQALVYCVVSASTAWTWNEARDQKVAYSKAIFDDLASRLEIPNPSKRWDSPLFLVEENQDLPIKDISEALFQSKAAKPSSATVQPKLEETNYVYNVDRVTQEIVRIIIELPDRDAIGQEFKIIDVVERFTLSKRISVPHLNRLRREYLKLAKLRPPQSRTLIAKTFVDFLNNSNDT